MVEGDASAGEGVLDAGKDLVGVAVGGDGDRASVIQVRQRRAYILRNDVGVEPLRHMAVLDVPPDRSLRLSVLPLPQSSSPSGRARRSHHRSISKIDPAPLSLSLFSLSASGSAQLQGPTSLPSLRLLLLLFLSLERRTVATIDPLLLLPSHSLLFRSRAAHDSNDPSAESPSFLFSSLLVSRLSRTDD